jgi:hypothetical protein
MAPSKSSARPEHPARAFYFWMQRASIYLMDNEDETWQKQV